MQNIFIHIGTHKTGSTTIQHALRQSCSRSQSQGCCFAATPRASRQIMRSQDYDKALAKGFREDFVRSLNRAGGETIVFSSEALSGTPNNSYLNSSVVSSILRDSTKDFDVKIIIYLRRQDDFIQSMYTQTIQQGDSHSFADFMKGYETSDSLRYSRIIGDFAQQFSKENVVVRSYHSASNIGLIRDFQSIIGHQDFGLQSQIWRNPSYSVHALEIAKRANSRLNESDRKILRSALQRVMHKPKNESLSLFSNQEHKELLKRFADDNRWVAQNYMYEDASTAFPPPPEEQAKAQPPLTHDEVSSLVVELLFANQMTQNDQAGLVGAARVALAGYPKLSRVIRALLHR